MQKISKEARIWCFKQLRIRSRETYKRRQGDQRYAQTRKALSLLPGKGEGRQRYETFQVLTTHVMRSAVMKGWKQRREDYRLALRGSLFHHQMGWNAVDAEHRRTRKINLARLEAIRAALKARKITYGQIAGWSGNTAGWVGVVLRGGYPFDGAGSLPENIRRQLVGYGFTPDQLPI